MPAIEGMTAETLGLNAVVKFNAACPVMVTLVKDGASISTGTYSGKDTMTVEIPGDYVFKDTCECTSSYTIMYAGDAAAGGVDNSADIQATTAAVIAEGGETQTAIAANTVETTAIKDALVEITGDNCNGDKAFNTIRDGSDTSVERVFTNCQGQAVRVMAWYGVCTKTKVSTYLTGSVLASTMPAHAIGDTVADLSVAPWSGYFDAAVYPNGAPTALDDVLTTGFMGAPENIEVRGNDSDTGAPALVAGSEVNGAVTQRADGSFDVTASACTGSFKYTSAGGCEANVTWDWTNRDPVTTVFSTSNETTVNLALVLRGGSGYEVDWGDGNTSTGVSSATVYVTHTYGASYTGDITVTHTGCDEITEWRSTSGHWDFGIGTLPTGLTYYSNTGKNTTSGDIGTLPAGLTYHNNEGHNTTSGDIGTLPAGLTYYNNTGQNTTSGDIGTLPAGLTRYNNGGQNTTNGDIGTLPTGLTYYGNIGQNTTSGDIGTLPAGLATYNNLGQNTTNGDIGTLPTGLTYYGNIGQNTTSGDIGTLPAGLATYNNLGQNTTSGDIGTLPTGLTYYGNIGQNTTTMNSATWPLGTSLRYFTWHGVSKPQLQVDNVLSALTAVTTWTNEKTVSVAGLNAAPSAAGLASRDTILANGAATVTTN